MNTTTPDYERLRLLVSQGDREAAKGLIPLTRRAGDWPWALLAADVLAPEDISPWTIQTPWIELVVIPRGPFWAGWWALERQEVPTFAIARRPVTNAQYAEFVRASGYAPPDPQPAYYLRHWKRADACPEPLANHPVTNVAWRDVLACCAWAGLTLPTALMWQKAARGLDARPYPWGYAKPATDLLRFKSRTTGPVDEFAHIRSPWGCEGMLGNVGCWCAPNDAPSLEPAALQALYPKPSTTLYQHQNPPVCGVAANTARPSGVHVARVSATSYEFGFPLVGFRPALVLPSKPPEAAAP